MSDDALPFFTQVAVLDTYIKMKDLSSSPEIVELIAKSLKLKPELYTYFFRNRPEPAWAMELLSHGYFVDAPALVGTKQGYYAPRWEEQEYLISIAQKVPQVVVEHIKRIQGHGSYYEKAIKALEQIPLEMIEEVIPIILDWLNDKEIAPYISLEVLALIKVLARCKSKTSFLLFQKITTPLPSNNTRTIKKYTFPSAAVSMFPLDDYDFEKRTLKSISSALQEFNIEKTISILETQLCEALRVEAETANDISYESRSYWRNAIEHSGQDLREEYKDHLLIALRDALEKAAQDNPENLIPLIERYLANPYEILQRLGFHILTKFPDKFTSLVAREILKPKNMNDIGIHHEYFTLLKNGYPYLGTNEQEQLVNVIILGLSKEKLEGVSRLVEYESEEERKKFEYTRSQIWIRDRLWTLKDYLQGEHKEILGRLITEFGEPEHPDFTRWVGGAFTVSYVSPITVSDLGQKSNEDLLDYLKNWEPAREFGPERESYGALGQQIASLVMDSTERYETIVNEIASIHADFATALINISVPENKFQQTLELRLNICERLLANEQIRTSLEELTNGRWVYFRFAIVEMCEKVLTNDQIKLPETYWLRIRDLLTLLSEDPDPNFESDRPKEGWFGNNDPLTVAINHVRSKAVLSLIYYAQHVVLEKNKNSNVDAERELEPVTKGVLTLKVRCKNDFSLAVHSVFGRELNRLYWMDKKWVNDNLDEIFPMNDDEESIAFYVAAWDSYVVSTQTIMLDLFELLRSRYERAIENISKGYVTKTHLRPIEALSHHLLLEYQLANYHINSTEGQKSLIAKFFDGSLPNHRGEAAWALSERTHQNSNEWQRARELWAWRLEVASNANHNNDFKPEMEAFSQLISAAPDMENITTLWPLLEGFLPYLEGSEQLNRIWYNLQKYLAKEVERDPSGVIRFYTLMHDRLSGPKWYYEAEARKILNFGAMNKKSRKDTLLLVDKINRKGNYEFKDIQERILAEKG